MTVFVGGRWKENFETLERRLRYAFAAFEQRAQFIASCDELRQCSANYGASDYGCSGLTQSARFDVLTEVRNPVFVHGHINSHS